MVYFTKGESAVVIVLLSVLLLVYNIIHSVLLKYVLLSVTPLALVFFMLKRKELYFIWSLMSPRITGVGPMIEYILEFAREEGPGNGELNDLLRIDLPFAKPLFFIFKPAYLHKVLSEEAENFRTRGAEGPVAQMAMGPKNIFTSEGPSSPHWKLYRDIVSGINQDRFGEHSIMAKMFASTWKTTQELTHIFDAKRGENLDLFYQLHHILVPTLHHAIFGEETAKKYSYKELPHEVYEVLAEMGPRFTFPYVPGAKDRIFKSQTRRISDAVKNMGGDSSSAVVALLQDAHKKGQISDEELQSNLLIFAYAHAPLNAVFWALYALALHPEDTKKVVMEIATVLSKGPMTYDRLGEFKYLSKVVAETLRLYPSVGLMQVRFPEKSTTLGKHFVPEGSFIFVSHYIVHRNAKYWPDADDFNPMREGLDTLLGENLNLLPFGYGPRVCAGRYFAQDFVKVALISLLQHHQIELAPGQKGGQPTSVVFLSPGKPVYFKFSKRELPTVVAEEPSTPRIREAQQQAAKKEGETSKSKGIAARLIISVSAAHKLLAQHNIFKEAIVSAGKANAAEVQLLVLFGSQSGHSRALALRLAHMANLCKLSALCVSLAEFDVSTITKYKYVIVCTSTFGDGGPPENAEKFNAWLDKQSSTTLFSGVFYAVLSLGSSMYPRPFKFGTYVSRRFGELGAQPLMSVKSIDEVKYNQDGEFTTWSVKLLDTISQNQNQMETKALVARNKLLGFQNFDFNLVSTSVRISFTNSTLKKEPRAKFSAQSIVAQVSGNYIINKEPTNRLYALELTLPVNGNNQQQAPVYEAGDSVSVLPCNSSAVVESLISRLKLDGDRVFVSENQNSDVEISCSLGKNKCTPYIAFSYFYDITSPPTVSLLKYFAMHCTDPTHQNSLTYYASNYRSFLLSEQSLLDVLELFPTIQIFKNTPKEDEEALGILLGLLGPIKPRYYSIASASCVNQNLVRVVYKVVEYTTKSGVVKQGLCSNYLESRRTGDSVVISIIKSRFKLPASSSSDKADPTIIMVGAGSGISPYFSFLEQRGFNKKSGAKLGNALLLHGCHSEADFAMKETVDGALKSGLLNELWTAYSKKAGDKPVHIQDIIEEKQEMLWNLLQNENAILYICGDIRIGTSVRDALIHIAKNAGKMNSFKAYAWLESLSTTGRLKHDEWGSSTQSGESLVRAARIKLWRKSIVAALAFSLPRKTT